MTRVATVENEAYLLNIADYGTAQHMEVLVKAEDFNAVEADENKKSALGESQYELRQQQSQQENRFVTCNQDDDGIWIIKAKLPAEEAGLIAKVLNQLGDQLAGANSALSSQH